MAEERAAGQGGAAIFLSGEMDWEDVRGMCGTPCVGGGPAVVFFLFNRAVELERGRIVGWGWLAYEAGGSNEVVEPRGEVEPSRCSSHILFFLAWTFGLLYDSKQYSSFDMRISILKHINKQPCLSKYQH